MAGRVRERDAALQNLQRLVELAKERVGRSGKSRAEHARIDRPAAALALEISRQLLDDAQPDLYAAVEFAECVVRLHEAAARREPQPELLVLLGCRMGPFRALPRTLVLAGHPERRRDLALNGGEAASVH